MPVDITPPPPRETSHWFAGPDLAGTASSTPPAQPRSTLPNCKSSPRRSASRKPTDYVQLLCTATLPGGARADATRMTKWKVEGAVGQISPQGRFSPLQSGRGRIVGELAGRRVEIRRRSRPRRGRRTCPVSSATSSPVLSRAGCNAGTCHGAAKGKNGFKLSLRGYDPLVDHRGAHRRPCRAADQYGLARRQPDAAQADGRRAAPGRASVRASRRPTIARCGAGLPRAPSSIRRPPAWRRSTSFPKTR